MTTLWQQYQALKTEHAHLFQYDAAKLLHVSEGELLASAPNAVYLGQDYRAIFERLQAIDSVQLLVRNEHVVHEKITRISSIRFNDHVGLAIDVGGFDVRLFPKHWHHVFAHDVFTHGKTMRSIQFYDAHGIALQKVYLQNPDDNAAWQAIVDDFTHAQMPQFLPPTAVQAATKTALTGKQAQDFRQRWRELKNIHHFFGLLKDHGLTRRQAFEEAPTGYAFQVKNACLQDAYEQAAAKAVPVITFVGNHGIIQIQTGTVKHISRQRGWLNIFDQKHTGFTLHVNDDAIESTWLLLRPTADGIVSCLECLDAQGNTVLSLFGQRVEGETELESWREVLQDATGHAIAEGALS